MRITTLGCSASITGELRTTCYQVDDDILIDAGSGAGDLSLAQSIAIDTVFLTHSHLDHCAFLPMLADAAGSFRDTPLTVYALPETIAALKEHMLNSQLWPDYTILPAPERPYIRFRPIRPGETVELGGRRYHRAACTPFRSLRRLTGWTAAPPVGCIAPTPRSARISGRR